MNKHKFDEYSKKMIITNSKYIYDSCAAKDYLENLRCFFTESNQNIIEESVDIKPKNISIIDVDVNVDSILFQKDFFTVNQSFFFNIEFESIMTNSVQTINSLCIFSKKITLYGGNSNIHVFSSNKNDNNTNPMPTAVVQVSNPIIFNAELNNVVFSDDLGEIPIIPNKIIKKFDENLIYLNVTKYVTVTLGLFTTTHTERNNQILIPCCDFAKPGKECTREINTREEFNKMDFPIDNFFPN